MNLRVILEPSDEGGFTVYVPSLPGCISEGGTMEEALANIREAIDLYLEEEEPLPLTGKVADGGTGRMTLVPSHEGGGTAHRIS